MRLIIMIKHLEKENLADLVATGVHVVDFYADWCGPCKMMGSVLEKMDDVNVIKVNTDMHQELAMQFGVMSIPTLVFFKEGKEVSKSIGFKDESEIRSILKELN